LWQWPPRECTEVLRGFTLVREGHQLYQRSRHREAEAKSREGAATLQKVLGEQHPDTASSYNNLAFCLYSQAKYAEAARHFESALLGQEFGRLKAAGSGFERSLFRDKYLSPRAGLAVCLVRLEKPLQAWEQAESNLARGLLDDLLLSAGPSADADKLARLDKLDQALIPLLVREQLSPEQTKQRDTLAKERDDLVRELAAQTTERSRRQVLPLESIQKQIATDIAVVFWLETPDDHLGCVLRRQGPPVWVRLPGSGKGTAWREEDGLLPVLAYWSLQADFLREEDKESLLNRVEKQHRESFRGAFVQTRRPQLLTALHRQRIAPLEPHLKGVRHLLVVPSGPMSAVPVEALTDRYLVSYIPSASVYARAMQKHRPLEASSLLVLADPVFTRTAPHLPLAPPHGLLVKAVVPKSLAARIRLVPGDVLLEYNGQKLTTVADFKPATGADRVPLKLWREGRTLSGRIPSGKLGVVLDRRPIAEALTAWRKQESELLALGRGDTWQALPGTRLEARTLTQLLPATVLLGSDASEQKLTELASAGKLQEYRLLHLATHGQANAVQPRLTALILSQDHLPTLAEAAELVQKGQKPPEGRLTVETILKQWELDADLVVLSACQTGLGKQTSGEGMLGFTQALLQKGARSVVLSRWKVDDGATSLLMARFYQNLLGKRQGLKKSMKRAEALQEAKVWLRGLSRTEAQKHLAALVDGVPRGERGSIKAALPTRKPDAPKGEDRPFEHPYFWAAFVLIGDPE
jgi:CHAT domain-containing protein